MLRESEAMLTLDDYELKMFFLVPLTNDALLLRICKNVVLILLYLKEVFYSSSNTYVFIMELQQPEEDFLT